MKILTIFLISLPLYAAEFNCSISNGLAWKAFFEGRSVLIKGFIPLIDLDKPVDLTLEANRFNEHPNPIGTFKVTQDDGSKIELTLDKIDVLKSSQYQTYYRGHMTYTKPEEVFSTEAPISCKGEKLGLSF